MISRSVTRESVVWGITRPNKICCCLPSNWVLFPTESKYVERWDALVGAAIFVTAFWTPYQAAFGRHNTISFDLRFFGDRALDAIFALDMVLQFFLAFPEEQHGAVRWIKDPGRIASNYLRGWFLADLLCVVPLDILFFYFSGPCFGLSFDCVLTLNTVDENPIKGLHAMRVLRMIRLVRLFRMLRLSRILVRWHCKIGVQYAHLSLIRFCFVTCLATHWLCCVWGSAAQAGDFIASMGLGDGTTWLSVMRVKAMKEWEERGRDTSGLRPFSSEPEVYILSLYWATATITSIGYGDIVPTNTVEYFISIVIMAIGSSIWAYVIGGICQTLSSMDPHTISFKQNMDDLNAMMSFYGFPQEMRRRLRLYVHESRNLKQRKAGQVLKADLSPSLRGEVEMQCNSEWMDKVFYLQDLPPEVVAEVSQALEQSLFAPGELIGQGPQDDLEPCLYIVQRGVVARQGRVFGRGAVFGEDMILHTDELRDQSMARAMSFVEVYRLSRSALDNIRGMYPEECRRIRLAQVRMAVRRKFILVAHEHRMRIAESQMKYANRMSMETLLMAGAPKRKKIVKSAIDQSPWMVSQNSILDRLERMEAFLDTRFGQLERRMTTLEENVEKQSQPVYWDGCTSVRNQRSAGSGCSRPV